jgi:ABC-type transport system involved in multi-copper enzyme maturation permease subunit
MSIVPAITRELRSQSRQPLTYLLRLAGSGAICLAFWLAYSSLRPPEWFRGNNSVPTPTQQQQQFQDFGRALFGKMNLTIFIAIWLLTPLAAADSISRERREGTLPLLRLTRLRPWEIVLGKSFVHIMRSSTVFLTMAPWLLIPFLFGGLSLADLQIALLIDVSALFLAQSAGLLASTFCRDWLKAVIWAEVLAVFLFLGMTKGYEKVLDNAFVNGSMPAPIARFGGWMPPRPGLWSQFYIGRGSFLDKHSLLLGLMTNGNMGYERPWFMGRWSGNGAFQFESSWQQIWTALNPHGRFLWIGGSAKILAASIAVFGASIFLGALCVQRTWQEDSRSEAWEKFRQKYFTPKYGVTTLRKRLSGSLTRNPIGWLHHYSPSARLTKWLWCLFLIGIEMFFVGNSNDLYAVQAGLGFLLLLGLIFSSTGSFRSELETGAFELLLVTPIREGQILFGRVRGIWQQFLPAFVVYGAGVLFLASGWSDKGRGAAAWQSIFWFGLLFLSAPFIGLYFSLLRWNFLMAWLCASVLTMLLPVFVRGRSEISTEQIIVAQVCVAGFFAWRIRRRLQNRLALSAAAQTADA